MMPGELDAEESDMAEMGATQANPRATRELQQRRGPIRAGIPRRVCLLVREGSRVKALYFQNNSKQRSDVRGGVFCAQPERVGHWLSWHVPGGSPQACEASLGPKRGRNAFQLQGNQR
jgi:hypothetical protein